MIYKTKVSSRLVEYMLDKAKDGIESKVVEIQEHKGPVVTLTIQVKMLKEVAIEMLEDKGKWNG